MAARNFLQLVLILVLLFCQKNRAYAHDEFIEVIANSKPSIVRIEVLRTSKSIKSEAAIEALGGYADFFSEDIEDQSKKVRGTGFVIDYDEDQFAYIMTAAHVVRGASKVKVAFQNARPKKADVVWVSKKNDVALLKLKSSSYMQALEFEVEAIKEGQAVLALSDSFNVSISGAQGIVSAKDVILPSKKGVKLIQTDAATNPGSSGGVLLNKNGKVVGMISNIYTKTGTFSGASFAVPAKVILELIMSKK